MKCKYCGKNISKNKNFWITINNDGSLQGMEDQIFFCNKNCFKPWKTNYLRQKSRQKKANYKEKLLEIPEKKATYAKKTKKKIFFEDSGTRED